MHHPITAGHTQHTSKALEALHKQRDKKQAEAEAARRNLTGTDVHYDGAEASKYDAVWASADRASLTPWESFVRGTFGYSLVDRENASAGVRTGRFLATYLELVVGGLEWVPRPARRA